VHYGEVVHSLCVLWPRTRPERALSHDDALLYVLVRPYQILMPCLVQTDHQSPFLDGYQSLGQILHLNVSKLVITLQANCSIEQQHTSSTT
jgi:hypothetical protein